MAVTDTRTREEIYDAEIAPAILAVGKLCERHGMSIVVAVEYGTNEVGQTCLMQEGRGFGISLVDLAVRARGNVDSLILAVMKHARTHGHSSLMLKQLGVEPTPEAAAKAPEANGG